MEGEKLWRVEEGWRREGEENMCRKAGKGEGESA